MPESGVLPEQVVQAATEFAALGPFRLVDEVVADRGEEEPLKGCFVGRLEVAAQNERGTLGGEHGREQGVDCVIGPTLMLLGRRERVRARELPAQLPQERNGLAS